MQIELLSPAKNAEIGIAAINCGADSVYIAAEKFGAREDAGNSLQQIEKLIDHAHKYYARVYIALNTILRNDELEEALKLINSVYSLGADGLIIQDLGLLELSLPPIPLIASTQMFNESVEKVLFFQNIGFKRVILPRELTLNQIKEIRSKTTIELECFIHGSLCVSYGGQCYLSYAIGGRSANRGACAQPCRQTYSLIDEDGKILAKNKHLLSLKNLDRSAHLKNLIDAGVTSFKIEGRLKDLAYVTNITSFYRKKLDGLIENKKIPKSSSGKTIFDFIPDPNKTFNRGYTDFCLEGKKNKIASLHTPKSLGERIGTVKKIAGDHFILEQENDLKNGDGICFFDHSQVLRGTLINKAQNAKIYPDKMYYLEKGTEIYRNYDKAFVKILEKSPCRRRIDVTFRLEDSEDGLNLGVRDEDGNTGAFSIKVNKVKAEKKELAETSIKSQLSKLNDTIFDCKKIIVKCSDVYFVPFSILNQLRRGTVADLLVEREKNRPKEEGRLLKNDIPYPAKNITYLGNCLNSKTEEFYKRH
ncbi:MAG TPA: U32 family peptidase, partial [Candidatus Omnitrophota bacterium]|nr:U32 family peptidase [Candidatus Omnitrophota bacterium]